jgi:hypothetical protein
MGAVLAFLTQKVRDIGDKSLGTVDPTNDTVYPTPSTVT